MTETSANADEGLTQGPADQTPLATRDGVTPTPAKDQPCFEIVKDNPGAPATLKMPSAQNGSAARDAGFRQEDSSETPSPFANSLRQQMYKDTEEVSQDEEEEDELHCVTRGPPQRMVSWQDEVGRDLFTVREFEPSESGHELSETSWDVERKTCCSIM